SGSSAPSGAPVAPRACPSCAGPWTSPSSPSCMPSGPGSRTSSRRGITMTDGPVADEPMTEVPMTEGPMTDWVAVAADLDAADPLADLVDRFEPAEGVVAYFDGNSLGRPVRGTAQEL